MMPSSPRVLVTGGNGQLAQSIKRLSPSFVQVLLYSKQQLDVTKPEILKLILFQERPQFVIHTAAFTAVDLAEDEKQQQDAYLTNVRATEYLATYCAELKIPLFFISTDYVFNGLQTTPYREVDQPNPINFYGQTKLLGEQAVTAYCKDYLILRVSGVYSEFGKNIFKTFYQKMCAQTCHVVADQYSSPTYAKDIAHVLLQLIKAYLNGKKENGIYHYCSQEILSWYDFACMIRALLLSQNIPCEAINPITLEQHLAKAKRPKFSALNCQKILQVFNIEQPQVKKGVEEALMKYETK